MLQNLWWEKASGYAVVVVVALEKCGMCLMHINTLIVVVIVQLSKCQIAEGKGMSPFGWRGRKEKGDPI